MQLHTYYSFTIDEHPSPELCYEWIRNNWHDLGLFAVDEALDSLKGFAKYFNTGLDYSISIVPDRGEYIRTEIDDIGISELSRVRLYKYLINNFNTNNLLAGNCPFTGVFYDEVLLDEIRDFIKKPDSRSFQELLNDCTHKLLSAIHSEGDYIYSDEGLRELCEANEYQFTESGEFS